MTFFHEVVGVSEKLYAIDGDVAMELLLQVADVIVAEVFLVCCLSAFWGKVEFSYVVVGNCLWVGDEAWLVMFAEGVSCGPCVGDAVFLEKYGDISALSLWIEGIVFPQFVAVK